MPNIKYKFDAETGKASAEIEQFSGRLRNVSTQAKGVTKDMIAVSAGVRLAEGNFGTNTRAVARWLSTIAGAGPILQSLFPLVGALAFAGAIEMVGSKVVDFFKKLREAPARIDEAFRNIDTPMMTRIDQLHLSTDRMNNDLARLQGHAQNNLKIMLDEAALSMDGLARELEKVLNDIDEATKKESISKVLGFFTMQAPTSGQEEEFNKFEAVLKKIDDTMQRNIRSARAQGDATGVLAAQSHGGAMALELINKQIEKQKILIETAESKQRMHAAVGTMGALGLASYGVVVPPDQTSLLHILRSQLVSLQTAAELYGATWDDTNTKVKLSAAQIAEMREAAVRPLTNLIKTLNADIAATNEKLKAVGKPQIFQAMAEGAAMADKAITKVKEELGKPGHPATLSPEKESEIRRLEMERALGAETLKTGEALAAATLTTKERSAAQERLTAAIGKGWEAEKAARTENLLQAEFKNRGGINLGIYGIVGGVSAAEMQKSRVQIGAELEAAHKTAVGETIDKLSDEIEVQQKVTETATQGSYQVAAAVEKVREEQVRKDKGDQYAAEMAKEFAARRTAALSTELSDTGLKIAATQRLISAQGQEARLAAEVANIRAESTAKSGAAVGGAAGLGKQLQEQLKVHEEADNMVRSYENQLRTLELIRGEMQQEVKAGASNLEIVAATRKLREEELTVLRNIELEQGTLSSQVHAFFADMAMEANKASRVFYDSMHSALDKISDQMAKLFTGQKTSFGKTFQSLGEETLKGSLKGLAQKGLSTLGQHVGGKFGAALQGAATAKPDGTKGNPLYVYIAGGGGAEGGGSVINGLPTLLRRFGSGSGDSAAMGTALSNVGSLVGMIPGLAGGGDSLSSGMYMVGERGPELLNIGPTASGRASVTPIDRASGGGVTYSVYAPNAELGAENRINRGIESAHYSAVVQGVRATHEREMRTPRRSAA